MSKFVHTHCHTSIGSMQDSMVSVDKLFKMAKAMGQSAIAITDHGTMAAVYDARKASLKYGVKYIPGIEAYFVDTVEEKKQKRKHLVLLAKNQIGYKNLLKLNYLGFKNGQYVSLLGKIFPRIDWKMLEQYNEGVICQTACGAGLLAHELFKEGDNGIIDYEQNYVNVFKVANRLKGIFGKDLYLEVQTHAFKKYKTNKKTKEQELDANKDPIVLVDQKLINKTMFTLSRELGVSMTATCDVHYLKSEDAKAHDLLMAVNDKKPLSDPNRHRYGIEEFYLKSDKEVIKHFTNLFDDPNIALELCANTIKIANKCEDSVYIDSNEIRFPIFNVQGEADYDIFIKWFKCQSFYNKVPEDHAYMRFKCVKAFKKKYSHLSVEEKKIYRDRITLEIKVFETRNFSSYMLITSDFICKAREHGIRVGPGRGSNGGSMVAHLLDIHEVDPIQYGLIFERFLNIYKEAFPDIDTDFSPDGRIWVEQYIVNKYGVNKVAHVSNLSTMTPKVVIKDIARSLELGGDKTEAFKIANKITDSISMDAKTFEDALKESKDLRDCCAQYPKMAKYGPKLVGLEKTFSTHAAGLVISDIDLTTYVPLRYDKEGTMSVQYEKNRCEDVGLIKMDLLGLEHLKVIDTTIANAKSLGKNCPDTDLLSPFNDNNVWNMISKGKTICVFQMGSLHMRALCKRIKPQSIEDLSLVNALGRPSAKVSREEYILRRDGKTKVSFKYNVLKSALKDTLGICVYEEQLAKMAHLAAGWNLNKADGLRKLTKLKGKDPAFAKQLEIDFVNDTVAFSKLTKSEAQDIWTHSIEPFAGYGFNYAHSLFYSLNGYHTAYYKYHYPSCFMAAVLKSEIEKSTSNKDKIKLYKKEAKRMGINVLAPDINKSGKYFSVVDEENIVTGIGALKGVGVKAVDNIIETGQEHPFVSFADFLYRTSSTVVRKTVIQAMAKAGCFDSIGITRKGAHDYYDVVRKRANKFMSKNFEEGSGKSEWEAIKNLTVDNIDGIDSEWNKKETLVNEYEASGDYFSGSFNDLYDGFFTNKCVSFKAVNRMADRTPVKIEAIIDSIEIAKTKSGKNKGGTYANCALLDVNGNSITMKIWSNKWPLVKDKMIAGKPIKAICKVNIWNDSRSLILENLEAVAE